MVQEARIHNRGSKFEQVETWTFLPAGLLRVFKAIIRRKQGILFLWCRIFTVLIMYSAAQGQIQRT